VSRRSRIALAAYDVALAVCMPGIAAVVERLAAVPCAPEPERPALAYAAFCLAAVPAATAVGILLARRSARVFQPVLVALHVGLIAGLGAVAPLGEALAAAATAIPVALLGLLTLQSVLGGGDRPAIAALCALALPALGFTALRPIPILLRHGPAPESDAIGELRRRVASEQAFARDHAGAYATPTCLANPRSCLGEERPPYLVPGPGDTGPYAYDFQGVGTAPAGLTGFAYTASTPGGTCRTVCADAEGLICLGPPEGRGPVRDGRCDPTACVPMH
jgi:hypothetical protein